MNAHLACSTARNRRIDGGLSTKSRSRVVFEGTTYKSIWRAVVGEVLPREREVNNVTDRYAVSVVKDRTTGLIGHLPRKVSKVVSLRRNYTV